MSKIKSNVSVSINGKTIRDGQVISDMKLSFDWEYDLPELLVNRNGPLPNDRPHNFKFSGAYKISLRRPGNIVLGMVLTAQSGTPIEVLGRHPTYGPNETFILPRGSGGRLPAISQLNLRVAYDVEIYKEVRAEVALDVFNVLNQLQVTSVDQQY